MTTPYFADLLGRLAERSKLATISQMGCVNIPLRRHLAEMFSRPFGNDGSFLADPTFEAVYGWKAADQKMTQLAGQLLAAELVQAMDSPPKELADDYRFAKEQFPYTHQLEAWKILSQPTPQSVVVASGTGSGKTECFMVPILDRLVRLREEKKSSLVGVRALFLYPLNALINSQRDRLRAWTHSFGSDIRFCLYNGNTEEEVREQRRREHPNEVVDRKTLRESPAPILVTNATMLEYMLVRTIDKPILELSQGKLEWIVLDEAHSYVGSQAAEVALLLRRVLAAFGVASENVRFVATSATIGDPRGEAGQKLRRFLADLAGVGEDRVHIVAGERQVPPLPSVTAETNESLTSLCDLDAGQEMSDARYAALSRHSVARKLRHLFVGNPVKPPVAQLSQVVGVLRGKVSPTLVEDQRAALRWLDLLSGTRNLSGIPFLPLRAHLFHQTLSGLWACSDPSCPEKVGSHLNDTQWPFGLIYLDPRKHCRCGGPVYEVVTCSDCGEVFLLAGEARSFLHHLQPVSAIDEFELEADLPEESAEASDSEPEEERGAGPQSRVLIANRMLKRVGNIYVEPKSRKLSENGPSVLRLLAHEEDGDGLICPACEGEESKRSRLFQATRVGAPFLLGNILPTLLEFAPDGEKPAAHPYRGRRLLTFNDSRQGTARMAARLQQDAERTRIRSLVYHLTLQHGKSQSGKRAADLAKEIETLVGVNSPALSGMIAEKKAEITRLSNPTPIPFNDLSQYLVSQGSDFERMLKIYRRFAPETFGSASGEIELARLFLVREFGRRPKRQNNLETMGMISVYYPNLDGIKSVPPEVVYAAGFTLEEWKSFLKLCLDYFVRGGGSLSIPPPWRQWLGLPFPVSYLVPGEEDSVARNQRRWPRAKRSGRQSILVRLLSHVLKADIEDAYGEDRIDAVLRAAWDALVAAGLFEIGSDGRVLPLDRLAFTPLNAAWVCPFTRRFLDTTLRGVSPYLPRVTVAEKADCLRVDLPLYDDPFGGVTDDLDRARRGRGWLAKDSLIPSLREEGLWSDLNDRVIELTPFFTAAEHSAQQDSVTLDRYEREFKSGDLNLLSCSTTMEMGIDIGGMAMVAMNNVPPHQANYLQRAGRAGRRKESRSVSMTLCKSNPHDQAVFINSRWAFDATLPVPRVSLDSAVIVQRHVNAFLLTQFLSQHLSGSDQEKTKLTCGWFFDDATQPAQEFIAWCKDLDDDQSATASGLRQLSRYSVFEGRALLKLACQVADAMIGVAKGWSAEWDALKLQEKELSRDGESSPAYKAVQLHQERMAREYLLRELATKGFLPAHGFPTDIAAFDNLTVRQLKQMKSERKSSREDNRFRRRELASRDRVTALREYAPGSEVVIDGLVYRSAGITLNWHVPADQKDVREIQNIRFIWRCHYCGASGSGHSVEISRSCHECGKGIRAEDIREFLEPAGFAVDFYEDPDNDVTTQHFVPVEAPWINAQGEWFPLANPMAGRFRVSTRGHIFNQSRGIHGEGYAICLVCGRAEPMIPGHVLPPAFEHGHRKLRGAKKGEVMCPGSQEGWKVKTGLALGHEAYTDLFELQLKTEAGVWLQDKTAALTLAVALRDSLAEAMGVQATELGCDVKEAKPEEGLRCQSIIIYDRFAAGYASNADRHLDKIFSLAKDRLKCVTANCDSACPHCILDFDQRFAADNLDRRAALEILTDNWMHSFSLPQDLAYFGATSRPEYGRVSEGIWRETAKDDVVEVRLYAGGGREEWDVGISPLRHLAYRLAGQDRPITISLAKRSVSSAEDSDLQLLASLADHPQISIKLISGLPTAGEAIVLAEVSRKSGSTAWATADASAATFGELWGKTSAPLIRGINSPLTEVPGKIVTAADLRPAPLEGDRAIVIHHELDGPIRGFGDRFWDFVQRQHNPTKALIAAKGNSIDSITAIRYHDRYLFTPASIALLAELVLGLRNISGEVWSSPSLIVSTTRERSAGGPYGSRNVLWADWQNTDERDKVIAALFDHLGMRIELQVAVKSQVQHGRILEIDFERGKQLRLRLDQGVSYWRAISGGTSGYHSTRFDFDLKPEDQAQKLANIKAFVEGGMHSTEVFVTAR
ncbi:DEAD/DEAH box helicase [Geomonas subterranea]|uniref:DEAD/DEAH box helicase n=1 Tax=Geomonas subterranea TaxID=2847989 RepID=UPI001CD4BCE9|nr:DEAD/DEAH box helicase [Geomonas fuzhouensis]